jgi:hypothetical protein
MARIIPEEIELRIREEFLADLERAHIKLRQDRERLHKGRVELAIMRSWAQDLFRVLVILCIVCIACGVLLAIVGEDYAFFVLVWPLALGPSTVATVRFLQQWDSESKKEGSE